MVCIAEPMGSRPVGWAKAHAGRACPTCAYFDADLGQARDRCAVPTRWWARFALPTLRHLILQELKGRIEDVAGFLVALGLHPLHPFLPDRLPRAPAPRARDTPRRRR